MVVGGGNLIGCIGRTWPTSAALVKYNKSQVDDLWVFSYLILCKVKYSLCMLVGGCHTHSFFGDCGRKCLMQDRTDFEKAPLVPDDWADLEECVKALGKKEKILLLYFIRQYGCAELLENQKAAFDLLETARQEGSEATHRYPPRKT